jgi:hypothetical protein
MQAAADGRRNRRPNQVSSHVVGVQLRHLLVQLKHKHSREGERVTQTQTDSDCSSS